MTSATRTRYQVVSYGRNHYVKDTVSGEFTPAVAFSSKRAAQARADEKNRGR